MKLKTFLSTALLAASFFSVNAFAEKNLLNVSYDPTRELYQEFNAAFAKYWESKTREKVSIKQSQGETKFLPSGSH